MENQCVMRGGLVISRETKSPELGYQSGVLTSRKIKVYSGVEKFALATNSLKNIRWAAGVCSPL